MLDFYYQTGDLSAEPNSFWTEKFLDLLIEITGTLGGGALALWLYKRQVEDEKRKISAKAHENSLFKLFYYSELVEDAVQYIDSIIDNAVDFNQLTDDNRYKIPTLAVTTTYGLDYAATPADREEIFHAYREVFATVKIGDFFRLIEYANSQSRQIINFFELYKNEIRDANQEIVRNFDEAVFKLPLTMTDPEIPDRVKKELKDIFEEISSSAKFPHSSQLRFWERIIALVDAYIRGDEADYKEGIHTKLEFFTIKAAVSIKYIEAVRRSVLEYYNGLNGLIATLVPANDAIKLFNLQMKSKVESDIAKLVATS